MKRIILTMIIVFGLSVLSKAQDLKDANYKAIIENFNYHIEIGSVGKSAREDKIQNKPIYSNGMLINTGFRMHF